MNFLKKKPYNPDSITKKIGIKKGSLIVDLGCGKEVISEKCAGETGTKGIIFAVHKQPELVFSLSGKKFEKNLQNIKPICFDFINEEYPFITASIDIVIITDIFKCPFMFPKNNQCIKKIWRILKPEGKLVLINTKKNIAENPLLKLSKPEIETFLSRKH